MTNVVVDSTLRGDRIWDLSDFQDGDTVRITSAVSYLNFFVTNKTVLIPKYWKPGLPITEKEKDDFVKKVFTEIFNDRKIVQIHTISINRGGGGIHCATQQQPAVKKTE
jgi:agmatine deiminase